MKTSKSASSGHYILMAVVFFYILVNLTMPELKYASITFSVCLFLFYTWRRILTILITALIAAGLVAIFPFLAPIAFIIMVVIFLARLGFIIENWRAVVAGFYMYAVAFGFALNFFDPMVRVFWHLILSLDIAWRGFSFFIATACIVAFTVTFVFHLLMKWLYSNGYTLKTAMPIMGVAPLLIMLLFLPFVKAFDGFDTGVDTADTVDSFSETTPAYVKGDVDATPDAPGYHHTHDYYRTAHDGTVQHVRGYIATNPDGIVENNLSYKGESITDVLNVHNEANMHDGYPNGTESTENGFAGADAGRTKTKRK